MLFLWEGGSWCDSLSDFGLNISVHAAGMEGEEDTGGLHHDFTPGGSGPLLSGKRRLMRGGVCHPDK